MTGQVPAAREEVLKSPDFLFETEMAATLRPVTSKNKARTPLVVVETSIFATNYHNEGLTIKSKDGLIDG